MARIPTYRSGGIGVSELEGAVRATLTPERAALGAAAKFSALSSVTEAAGHSLQRIAAWEDQMQQREDYRAQQLAEAKLKEAATEFMARPEWDHPTTSDGTPTQSYMRQQWQETMQSLRDGMGEIKDPKTRDNFKEIYNVAEKMATVNVEDRIRKRRMQTDAEIAWDLVDISAKQGDFKTTQKVLSEMHADGHITDLQYKYWSDQYETVAKQDRAQEILNTAHQFFMQGQGDQFYKNQVENPDSDPETQKMIMAGLNQMMLQFQKAQEDQRNAEAVRLTLLEDQLNTEIMDNGGWATMDLRQMYDNGELGTGTDGADRYVRLHTAQRRAAQAHADDLSVATTIATGGYLNNDSKTREGIDKVLLGKLEQMGLDKPEDITNARAAFYRRIGQIGEADNRALKRGLTDANSLAAMFPLYDAMTRDGGEVPEMNLTGREHLAYEMMQDMVGPKGRYVEPVQAAQIVLDRLNMDEDKKAQLEKSWQNGEMDMFGAPEDEDKAPQNLIVDTYQQLIDSDQYDMNWWWGFSGRRPPPQEAFVDFQNMTHDAFMAGANYQTAIRDATRRWQMKWQVSNFNSPDGKYEFSDIPLSGNLTELRNAKVSEIVNAQQYLARDTDGTPRTMTLDPKNISFHDPKWDGDTLLLKIYYNNSPLITDTVYDKDGNFVMHRGGEIEISPKERANSEARSRELASIKGLESDLEKVKALQRSYAEGNKVQTASALASGMIPPMGMGAGLPPTVPMNMMWLDKAELKNLPNEQKFLEQQISERKKSFTKVYGNYPDF